MSNQEFSTLRGVVLDMDGVLYRGDEALPDAATFIQHLHGAGVPRLYLTNNATRSPVQYVDKLARMGIAASESTIITSALATLQLLQHRLPSGARVLVIGEDPMRAALTDAGFQLVDRDVQAVVVGMDRSFTYDGLKLATYAIRAGALFVGTNPDCTFPNADGIGPGAGALIAAVQAATDIAPLIAGKPAAPLFHAALDRLDLPANQTLMIGDRLETDIWGAADLGMPTALVLTGVTNRAELAAAARQSTWVFDDLTALWRRLASRFVTA